ncbi:MAG: hypothetical protein AB1649_17915, partial [Chloroflexota bacterium]
EALDSNLISVAFFIPVITPRYLQSVECRREIQSFVLRASNLGIRELVLPLIYVDVPDLNNAASTDEVMRIINTYQWKDWRDLRFFDVTSGEYRRAVAEIASRLVEVNQPIEKEAAVTVKGVETATIEPEESTPGFIDRLSNYEETLKTSPKTMEAITAEVQLIGQIMTEGTADIKRANSQGKGFSARLAISRRVATRLNEPVEHIWTLANTYASQINTVDDGLRIILQRAQVEAAESPEKKAAYCRFFESVRKMAAATQEALRSGQGMFNAVGQLENMSRDMRPVVKRLKQGLAIQLESMEISKEWVPLIEATGITCDDAEISG